MKIKDLRWKAEVTLERGRVTYLAKEVDQCPTYRFDWAPIDPRIRPLRDPEAALTEIAIDIAEEG